MEMKGRDLWTVDDSSLVDVDQPWIVLDSKDLEGAEVEQSFLLDHSQLRQVRQGHLVDPERMKTSSAQSTDWI